jgi:hypothetical protein
MIGFSRQSFAVWSEQVSKKERKKERRKKERKKERNEVRPRNMFR